MPLVTRGESVPEIKHSTVTANNVKVHFWRKGTGEEVLVFLHGFPQTARAWEKVTWYLPADITVVAPDLRGCGDSQRPAAGYDKKTMAADVHELVRSLGFDRVTVVGHDIGAAVAYAYASQWPSATKRLVLIEMLLPGFGLEALYSIQRPGEFAWMPFFMTQDLPEWLITGREAPFLEWFIRNMLSDQAALTPEDIASYAKAYTRPGALRAAFDSYRAFWQDAEDNKRWGKSKLSMPVLAIGADQSIGSRLAESLKPLTTDLKGLVFEGCGHFIPDEQPEKLAMELRRFLSLSSADTPHPSDQD